MEKRVFLAFALSFFVLFGWSLINNQQQTPQDGLFDEETKHVDIHKPAKKPGIDHTPTNQDQNQREVDITQDSSELSESYITVENPVLTIVFNESLATIESVKLNQFDYIIPAQNIGLIGVNGNLPKFKNTFNSRNKIIFKSDVEGLDIVKEYIISSDNLIEEHLFIQNLDTNSTPVTLTSKPFTLDMSSLDNKSSFGDPHARDKSLFEYVVKTDGETIRKAGAYKFSSKHNRSEDVEPQWVAFRDRYFSLIYDPQYQNRSFQINALNEKNLTIQIQTDDLVISGGEKMVFVSRIFAGPEKTGVLREINETYPELKMYYRFGLFDAAAKFIYRVMHFIHKFVPNWGMVIIILSVLIYFSMYPLTLRGMVSMRRMQLLQPKIAALKEKHQSNPQKMNKEMMELYKENKINPIGGCLPFLFQMPVFIGLYQVLWRSVSLKGADFLWIKDLSEPDRLMIFPFNIPFIGNEFNILPILMMIIMFVQQKFTSKNMVSSTPEQLAQQKIMSKIMPIFLGVIFYKFASGLTLYFTMFYLFSTFTQWKMSKISSV